MECIIHNVDFRKNHLEKLYFVWLNVIYLIVFGSQEWHNFYGQSTEMESVL